jgi:hypothetical protein
MDALQQRLQIVGKEIVLEYRHSIRDPEILGGTVMPEVLVGIDSHGFWEIALSEWRLGIMNHRI